jgi:2-polyprenyl-3-methyl-5-hydroxy-6-metoxy-1,4-benzoquinol methylase
MVVKTEFRERFYEYYLSTQSHVSSGSAQRDLDLRGPYLKALIKRWFPNNRSKRILDLGCGYSALLYFLREAGYRNLCGVDTSSEQVATANKLGLDFVKRGDVLGMLRETADASYDVLVSLDLLEHLTRDEILICADHAYRVLKPGGTWLIHVPNAEGIFFGSVFFSDLTHETLFTRQSLRQVMNVVGFNKLQVSEDVPIIHGIPSALRFVTWKISRTVFRIIYAAETGDWSGDLVLSQNLLAIVEK